MPQPLAFLFIETQFDNLGDALINRELLRLMARHASVTAGVSRLPASFRQMLGENALRGLTLDEASGRSRFLLNILVKALKGDRCFVFLSPGGWIGELDGRLNMRSWLHTLLYYVLKCAGARICQLGVSYENPGPKLRFLLRGRSGAMHSHYVRDTQSRNVAAAIPVRIDGVCPDLAFNAFAETPTEAGREGGVTFSFRVDQYSGQMDDVEAFLAFYIKEAPGGKEPIYFIAQVEKDIDANRHLAAWVKERFGLDATYADACGGIATAEKLYRRSTAVVSNRLHALLLAGSVGNAMIAAPIGAANAKICALFSDIGLADHVFSQVRQDADGERLRRARARPFDAGMQKKALEDHMAMLFSAPSSATAKGRR